MNLSEIKAYYNTKPVEYIIRHDLSFLLKEDSEFIPRFTLKNIKEISEIPVNMPIKPTEQIITKAIKYGLIFNITYKGQKDKSFAGHSRVIYPMVFGKSSKGKLLIRGYHLTGWSVSGNGHVDKIWRMFRFDRIQAITFMGSFYRLPPSGYNSEDKGMRGGIIARADFNEIRRNQQALVKSNQIQNKEDIELGNENNKFVNVKVKSTGTQLDMNNPLDNAYINSIKDINNLRIAFLKSIYGNKYIAIAGSAGKPGNTAKLIDENRKALGTFRVMDSIDGATLKKIKRVKGQNIFDLYIFDKKV